MGLSIGQKIIRDHMIKGELKKGSEISIRIDQTLTQDSTGTMAYLQFEAMGIPRVKTEKSVAYIDHNTLQTGFENADDHKYIQTAAKKYGVYLSKPGNGICHQVHLERFAVPGKTLLGSDSHTPTAGGMGMLAIGAGGLDVAVAMGGGPYHITMPGIVGIELVGRLKPWVAAKDVILEVLRILTVKGGVNKIIEYRGEGVKYLSVPQRATITNMGAELGATTSIFESDEITREFLRAQGRVEDYRPLYADDDAIYDESYTINLDNLAPLAAKPHSPDNVEKVGEIGRIKVDQVAIGSCTNSSYTDMMLVAQVLKGKTVHPDVSLVISPGSKQVLAMLSENGALAHMVNAGARILESACGPCIGMGQSPATDAVSLRTFNRNFRGRSGTMSANVYLVSPEVAVASALEGYLVSPEILGDYPEIAMPQEYLVNDNLILPPADEREAENLEAVRGPNIKPFPVSDELSDVLEGKVLIKTSDNVTTDDIMPSNAKLLPYRSNIPHLAEYCLTALDPDFPKRAKLHGGGFILGGSNYGQGSSREHAALVPLYLGVKGVLAKSFARIHMANLLNSGIIPMTFINESDYDAIDRDDILVLEDAREQIKNSENMTIYNRTKDVNIKVKADLTHRQKEIILAGGLLNYTKKSN